MLVIELSDLLQQRIARGACKLVKADDAWMPADFLTKLVDRKKTNTSVNYTMNLSNAVPFNMTAKAEPAVRPSYMPPIPPQTKVVTFYPLRVCLVKQRTAFRVIDCEP